MDITLDNCLVVPGRTALPSRCVHTNEVVSGNDYRTTELPYTPSWMVPAMLVLSPVLVLLFVPMMHRRVCKMRFGLAPQVRRKYLYRKIGIGVGIAVSFLLPVLLILTGSELAALAAIGVFLLGFFGGCAAFSCWTSPIRVVKVQGDTIWLAGCSRDFLASLYLESPSVAGDGEHSLR